jgi:hypothetical protein
MKTTIANQKVKFEDATRKMIRIRGKDNSGEARGQMGQEGDQPPALTNSSRRTYCTVSAIGALRSNQSQGYP